MTGQPAGRRDNGLPSADWGALVDLDPRLADVLLERLAGAGVAAYVEPARAADPLRPASPPSRPLDRLWVDPSRAEAARAVVAAEVADLVALLAELEPGAAVHELVQPVPRHAARRVLTPPLLPEPPGPGVAVPSPGGPPTGSPDADATDDDAVFRQIVAGFDSAPDGPLPPWPAAEDAGSTPDLDAPRRRRPPVDRARRPHRVDDGLPAWLEPDRIEPAPGDGHADHYVPPPPPPAPRVSARTVGAVLVLMLGLVLLFAPQLLRSTQTPGSILLGIALLVGGAAGLVLRVRDAPADDTGPDDGAVV